MTQPQINVLQDAITLLDADDSPITDPGITAGIKALLKEALDYTTDWHAAKLDDRGHQPTIVYRKETQLAWNIVVHGRLERRQIKRDAT